MEDYWNPEDPSVEMPEEQTETETLFDEPAGEEYGESYAEEPPKPKKKKKKMTFKRKLRRAIRRFFKLPLLTRIIAGVLVLVVLVVIIVLLVVLPKNCKSEDAGKTTPVTSATATAEIAVASDTPEAVETPYHSYTSVPTATSVPTISQTIKPNERDAAIPFIRSRLVALGYMDMPQTNDELYDTATVNAIKRFQYRNFPDNVKDWDGYIGTKTYELLISDDAKAFYIKSGDTDAKLYDGELVSKLQRQLVTLGYLKSVTGNCDATTVNAIRSFQKANSLSSDGVAGQATLKLLASLVAEAEQVVPTEDAATISDPTTSPEA